jgi:hypothetical protein
MPDAHAQSAERSVPAARRNTRPGGEAAAQHPDHVHLQRHQTCASVLPEEPPVRTEQHPVDSFPAQCLVLAEARLLAAIGLPPD